MSNHEKAEEYITNGNYDKALDQYLKIKNLPPQEVFESLTKALEIEEKLENQKNHKKLVKSLFEALELNPEDQWVNKAFSYILKNLPESDFDAKEKGPMFERFSDKCNDKIAAKQGFVFAGENYNAAKMYSKGRDNYQKAEELTKVKDLYFEELKSLIEDVEIEKAISLLDEFTLWNEKHKLTTKEEIFSYWKSCVDNTIETLRAEEKSLIGRMKRRLDREEATVILIKDVFKRGEEINKITKDTWDQYFNIVCTMEYVKGVDFLVSQEVINSKFYSATDLMVIICEKIKNFKVETIISTAPIILRHFKDEKDQLPCFANTIESFVQKTEKSDTQLELTNILLVLYQAVNNDLKIALWKVKRAELMFRTKARDDAIKEVQEILKIVKASPNYIETLGKPMRELAVFMVTEKGYDEADKVFNTLFEMYQTAGDIPSAGRIMGDQAGLFYEIHRNDAPEILKKAMNLLDQYPVVAGNVQRHIGKTFYRMGKEEEAKSYFEEANILYLKDKVTGKEEALTLGKILEGYSRELLESRKRKKLYDDYYKLIEEVYNDWDLSDDLSKNLIFELQRMLETNQPAENINAMATKAGESIKKKQFISQLAKLLEEYSESLIMKEDFSNASMISETILEILENHEVGSLLKEIGVTLATTFLKKEETIIGSDLLERTLLQFEDDEEFQEAGDTLFETAILLGKGKQHDQAVAWMGRAVPYYEDAESPESIEKLCSKCLEISKILSDKGKDSAQLYINKCNEIIENTGIKIETNKLNEAYASYSLHLIDKTEDMVKYSFSGRKKRKKRQFFKKKQEDEF